MWDQLALADLPTSIDQLDLPDMLDLKDQPDLLAQLDPLVRKHISFYLYKQSFLNYVHVRASVISNFLVIYILTKKISLLILPSTAPAGSNRPSPSDWLYWHDLPYGTYRSNRTYRICRCPGIY